MPQAHPTKKAPAMSSSPDRPIVLDCDAHLARIRIQRPDKRNAMTSEMWRELAAAVGSLAGREVRALAISGSGAHFSAGADIAELKTQLERPSELLANAQLVQQVQKMVEGLDLPSVALIQGACVGGGVGLALCCDLRLATPDARFALTPVKLGLHYSLADTRRLAAVIGPARAREMLLTARMVDAETALEWGLINRIVDDAEALEAAGQALCESWVQASPDGLAATKRVLGALDGSRALDEEILNRQFLGAFSGPDFQEGASAFLDKRAPDFGVGKNKEDSA